MENLIHSKDKEGKISFKWKPYKLLHYSNNVSSLKDSMSLHKLRLRDKSVTGARTVLVAQLNSRNVRSLPPDVMVVHQSESLSTRTFTKKEIF